MNFQLYFHGQNTKTFDISNFDSSGLGPFKPFFNFSLFCSKNIFLETTHAILKMYGAAVMDMKKERAHEDKIKAGIFGHFFKLVSNPYHHH